MSSLCWDRNSGPYSVRWQIFANVQMLSRANQPPNIKTLCIRERPDPELFFGELPKPGKPVRLHRQEEND